RQSFAARASDSAPLVVRAAAAGRRQRFVFDGRAGVAGRECIRVRRNWCAGAARRRRRARLRCAQLNRRQFLGGRAAGRLRSGLLRRFGCGLFLVQIGLQIGVFVALVLDTGFQVCGTGVGKGGFRRGRGFLGAGGGLIVVAVGHGLLGKGEATLGLIEIV